MLVEGGWAREQPVPGVGELPQEGKEWAVQGQPSRAGSGGGGKLSMCSLLPIQSDPMSGFS